MSRKPVKGHKASSTVKANVPKKFKAESKSDKAPQLKADLRLWHGKLIRALLSSSQFTFWASSQDSRDVIKDLTLTGSLPLAADEPANTKMVFPFHSACPATHLTPFSQQLLRRHSTWVSDHGKDIKIIVDKEFHLHTTGHGANIKYDASSREAARQLIKEKKRLLFKDGTVRALRLNLLMFLLTLH